MFGFNYLKLGLLVAVALAIMGAVGYHYWMISGLQTTITDLTKANAALVLDKANLEASNKSQELRISQLETTGRLVLQEAANLRSADTALRDQLAAAERKILDAEARARLAALRVGRGAEHLLGVINRDTECTMRHFLEEGTCVAGVWRPSRR